MSIVDGTVTLTPGGDGIDAYTDAIVTGGTLSITSGGGASTGKPTTGSTKGIKAQTYIIVDGGTTTIDAGMTPSTPTARCA